MKNGKIFVLFGDDHDDTRQVLMQAAQTLFGWETVGARSAREMIDVMNECCGDGSESCVDAIVSDVQFHNETNGPRLTGISAIESIRKKYPNIPVLYYSAFISALNKTIIRRQGLDYVEKPTNVDDLLARVQYAIEFAGSEYKGPERRRTSVNRTHHRRRKTDRPVEVPRVVDDALQEAKARATVGER